MQFPSHSGLCSVFSLLPLGTFCTRPPCGKALAASIPLSHCSPGSPRDRLTFALAAACLSGCFPPGCLQHRPTHLNKDLSDMLLPPRDPLKPPHLHSSTSTSPRRKLSVTYFDSLLCLYGWFSSLIVESTGGRSYASAPGTLCTPYMCAEKQGSTYS